MRATCVLLRGNPGLGKRLGLVHPWGRVRDLTALTDNEKIETRRHCGYPAYGGTPSGFSSWLYYQVYGLLEYRMSNLAEGEVGVVRRYLGTLAALEAAIPHVSENLDTNQAAVWSRNQNELKDREQLYDGWRVRLCAFFGLPPGPGLRGASLTLIV
jgi:hypothetical protein